MFANVALWSAPDKRFLSASMQLVLTLFSHNFVDLLSIETQISADVYSTTNSRSVTAAKRKCYFRNEKTLDYYGNYTRSNCLMECSSKYIRSVCGCLPYFYPSKHGEKLLTTTGDKLLLARQWSVWHLRSPQHDVLAKRVFDAALALLRLVREQRRHQSPQEERHRLQLSIG